MEATVSDYADEFLASLLLNDKDIDLCDETFPVPSLSFEDSLDKGVLVGKDDEGFDEVFCVSKDDEGFDEGFCEDGEMPQDDIGNKDGEPHVVPSSTALDLQQLFADTMSVPMLTQLASAPNDDFEFDLGVDMLDAEHIQQTMVLKELTSNVPSLYGQASPSPSVPLSAPLTTLKTELDCDFLCENMMESELLSRSHNEARIEPCSFTCSGPLTSDVAFSVSEEPCLSLLSAALKPPSPSTSACGIHGVIPPTFKRTRHTPKAVKSTSASSTTPVARPLESLSKLLVSTGEPSNSPSNKSDTKTRTPEVVHMPFYQFKKILDRPDLPDQEKAEVKNIRRRGKNKMAAKNCRQRKLELITSLQQEVQKLKETRDRFSRRSQFLEKEIEEYKVKCLGLQSQPGSLAYHHPKQMSSS